MDNLDQIIELIQKTERHLMALSELLIQADRDIRETHVRNFEIIGNLESFVEYLERRRQDV